MKYTLLTGCTGLIGRYLLRDLLLADVPVIALARPSRQAAGFDRIEEILREWEEALGRELPRPIILVGDLHEPGLGIDAAGRAWLREHCGSVIHNAGNVVFHSTGEDREPWRTNVDGTQHLVEVAHNAGIDEFHYVSTAYVCGDRQGTILECEADCGQSFDSDYEDSKLAAECLVRAAGFRKLNILRPGSVTGDSVTGYTSTYHGVYMFAQFTYMAQQRAGAAPGESWNHPVRLFQKGTELHHMAPVDAVSQAIVKIVEARESEGKTYHLTPVRPCTGIDVEAALARYFGYYGVRFAPPEELQNSELNEMEQLFYEALSRGQHRYFVGDPTFDCRNTLDAVPEWRDVHIGVDDLVRLFDFAVQQRFGRSKVRR